MRSWLRSGATNLCSGWKAAIQWGYTLSVVPMLLIASAVGLASPRPSASCLTAERATHGTIFCSTKNVSFILAGRTTGGKYSIYDYRYRFLPHPGGVMHGGQRLIVFHHGKYLGQYSLSPPPYVHVRVVGTQVVLHVSASRETVRLNFSNEPPRELYINGETEGFGH